RRHVRRAHARLGRLCPRPQKQRTALNSRTRHPRAQDAASRLRPLQIRQRLLRAGNQTYLTTTIESFAGMTAAPRRTTGAPSSAAQPAQHAALVHRDVVGLVALDLVLRLGLARVMDVALPVDVEGMHAQDAAANPARLRVP